jgi:predicted nucleotidyltransferase
VQQGFRVSQLPSANTWSIVQTKGIAVRLTEHECRAIQNAAKQCFTPQTQVRLFGSRLDDNRRGGDIDLLVEPGTVLTPTQLVSARNEFIARLYAFLGEQRIDVIIAWLGQPDDRAVVQTARREGKLLCEVQAS